MIMKVYHVTTERKLARFKASKCILPPVRFWLRKEDAFSWSAEKKAIGRNIILEFSKPSIIKPLPRKNRLAGISPNIIPFNTIKILKE